MIYYIDSRAYVDPLHGGETSIGNGTNIWAFATVGIGAVIGERCTIGQYVHIGPGVKIGNGCKIQNGAQLFEGVTLEDDVFIGPHAVFTNVLTPRAFVDRKTEFKPTLIKRGASIGANATILCGITIGEYAMVGAGAVVTKDVSDYALVRGNPNERSAWVCYCGNKLQQTTYADYRVQGCPAEYACGACKKKYINRSGVMVRIDAETP